MKIKKILIANRGEIACRVIRTCRELGIKTVSIYADDDFTLPHVKLADERVCLGSGALKDTYLNQQKIIDAAKKLNADAIHPGYGFLSENASFCQNVTNNEIIFIGPSPESIRLMGDKTASKIQVEKIKGPLIPGYHGDNQDPAFLKSKANEIGYPVLVKASAGGGGKGMRVIESESGFEEGLASAKNEAMKSFGNDQVLIEKYILNPRHIEVQVFGDTHGNVVHFFERECSIQRRHQKVVEETPSIALNKDTRQAICKAAVEIAKSINYVGAGTVEFIFDQSEKFYFLEMNTRLQVEHPITEMVTGVDLVKFQIEVAQGEKLTVAQEQIQQNGHAIELRVYAEDPWNNFLPSVGKIQRIGESSVENLRLETGYLDGNTVTINYDPMLAKLVVWAKDRETCIKNTLKAIEEIGFYGTKTNREYLRLILKHPAFKKGLTYTNFVEKYKNDIKPSSDESELAANIAAFIFSNDSDSSSSWTQLSNFRNV